VVRQKVIYKILLFAMRGRKHIQDLQCVERKGTLRDETHNPVGHSCSTSGHRSPRWQQTQSGHRFDRA
jgi:hypothetical protein